MGSFIPALATKSQITCHVVNTSVGMYGSYRSQSRVQGVLEETGHGWKLETDGPAKRAWGGRQSNGSLGRSG